MLATEKPATFSNSSVFSIQVLVESYFHASLRSKKPRRIVNLFVVVPIKADFKFSGEPEWYSVHHANQKIFLQILVSEHFAQQEVVEIFAIASPQMRSW